MDSIKIDGAKIHHFFTFSKYLIFFFKYESAKSMTILKNVWNEAV